MCVNGERKKKQKKKERKKERKKESSIAKTSAFRRQQKSMLTAQRENKT
jgi:hypothetical protein